MIVQGLLASFGALTYATWNPSDKSANITLSGGNLSIAGSVSINNIVRSTVSKGSSSGKWYWESTITSGGPEIVLGIATSGESLTNYLGSGSGGYGYYGNAGQKVNAGSIVAYGPGFTTGDVIGIALDYSGATASITFYKNNISQGVAYSGISGTFFAAAGPGPSLNITTNFGASAFTYSPPTGFVGLS